MRQTKMTAFLRVVFLLACVLAVHSEGISQTYFRPSTSNSGTAYCVNSNGQIVPYCRMVLVPLVYLYTNGHLHDSPTHPISSVAPSSGTSGANGTLNITLTTTRVGQLEELYIEAIDYGTTTYFTYQVGYNDIYYNHHPEIWDKVGGTDTGVDTGHGDTNMNRWMETNAAYGIYYASTDYLAAHPEQSRLCLNDMALPFGGKFDIQRTWNSPHGEHDRGKAVDVGDASANQCIPLGSGIPLANRSQFRQMCINRGAIPQLSYLESGHVHCGWGLQ